MSDLNVSGMAISPHVAETIVSMAVREVEGVAGIGGAAAGGIRSLLPGGRQPLTGIAVDVDDDGQLHVVVHMDVKSGYVLPDVADNVRRAIADAIAMQVGVDVGSVDIFIDGIQFSK